jgi:hypothetical protein
MMSKSNQPAIQFHDSLRSKLSSFVDRINHEKNTLAGTILVAYEFGHFLHGYFKNSALEDMQDFLEQYSEVFITFPINNIKNIIFAYESNLQAHSNFIEDQDTKTLASILTERNIMHGLCCFDTLMGKQDVIEPGFTYKTTFADGTEVTNVVPPRNVPTSRLKIAMESYGANASNNFTTTEKEEIPLGANFINQTVIPLVLKRHELEKSFNELSEYGKNKLKQSSSPIAELKGKTAINLGADLLNFTSEYFLNYDQYPQSKPFEHKCTDAIQAAKSALGPHTTPEWLRMLSKVTQIVVGVLTGTFPFIWLAKTIYSQNTTGRPTFFHDITVGQGKLEKVEQHIENFLYPAFPPRMKS